jgi:metal-sulfur cluster biosynthetic enzyme
MTANSSSAIDNTMESTIHSALRDCFDPTLPCNIVDLGLVENITLTHDPEAPGAGIPGVPPRFRVAIAIVPTTQDEAAPTEPLAQLSAQIQNRLAGLEQVIHSEVIFLRQPIWTPQRITPAGRRLLGLDGNPNLIQINAAR